MLPVLIFCSTLEQISYMKYWLIFLLTGGMVTVHAQKTATVRMTDQRLYDKIKGGWAGQTIGVTFGGPVEFRYCGTFIQDYQPLEWSDSSLRVAMTYWPGLYDDIYMVLFFVVVFVCFGLVAPVDSYSQAIAHAGF